MSTLFSREQRWDELVALYEKQLRDADLGNVDRLGDMLQIAMLYWRKLGRPQDAESWFERIRKVDPAHRGMLDFYREYLGGLGDDVRLINVLGGAQRAAKDDQERTRIATELARLAEGQRNAQKAIEQYKSLLRHDPDNREAREALMRLYTQTEGHNALVELLRQQLERTDPKNLELRISILRQVADVYRTFIKSDTALVSVLNQIVQLDEQIDEKDVDELRELVNLYQKLGRWRDLLTYQLKLAEVTPDVEEKSASTTLPDNAGSSNSPTSRTPPRPTSNYSRWRRTMARHGRSSRSSIGNAAPGRRSTTCSRANSTASRVIAASPP